MKAKKRTAEVAAAAGGSDDAREPDYLWSGKAVFRCRRSEVCRFERVGDLSAVLRHEARHQPMPERRSAKETS